MNSQYYDNLEDLLVHVDKGTLNTTILPDYGGPTIKHSSYKMMMIIFYILISVAILLLIVMTIIQYNNETTIISSSSVDRYNKNKPEKYIAGQINQIFNQNSNPGAVSKEFYESYNHGYRQANDGTGLSPSLCDEIGGNWLDNKCECPSDKWGSMCDRNSYLNTYTMHNLQTSMANKDLNIFETYKADGLNFGQGINCADLCNNDNRCVAFIFDKESNKCDLLSEAPDVKYINFNPDIDGNVFINKERGLGRPKVLDKIVMYNGALENRFWLRPYIFRENYQLITVEPNTLTKLPTYFTNIINDSNLYIVYSINKITFDKAKSLVRFAKDNNDEYLGDDYYVHIPGVNSWQPPLKMTIDSCYMMAIYDENIYPNTEQLNENIRGFKIISGTETLTRDFANDIYLSKDSYISVTENKSLMDVTSNWSE